MATGHIADQVSMLFSKDLKGAYKSLQLLESASNESDEVYPYLDQFIEMMASDEYVIRVRGFRLACKQAKWDHQEIIDRQIGKFLRCLDDDKPTAVRQEIAAMYEVVNRKENLRPVIMEKLNHMDYSKYNDTMQELIYKDVSKLLNVIEDASRK